MDLYLMNRMGVIFQPRESDTERPKSGKNQASQQLPQSSGKNIPQRSYNFVVGGCVSINSLLFNTETIEDQLFAIL